MQINRLAIRSAFEKLVQGYPMNLNCPQEINPDTVETFAKAFFEVMGVSSEFGL